MSSPDPKMVTFVKHVVGCHQRKIICHGELWNQLTNHLADERLFGDVEPLLDSLDAETQQALRQAETERPHSLCDEERGEFYRRVIQAWCRQSAPHV